MINHFLPCIYHKPILGKHNFTKIFSLLIVLVSNIQIHIHRLRLILVTKQKYFHS